MSTKKNIEDIQIMLDMYLNSEEAHKYMVEYEMLEFNFPLVRDKYIEYKKNNPLTTDVTDYIVMLQSLLKLSESRTQMVEKMCREITYSVYGQACELEKKSKKGGRASAKYKPYEKIIKRILDKYLDSPRGDEFTQDKAQEQISSEIFTVNGEEIEPSLSAFKAWLKYYKASERKSIYPD